MVSEAAEAVTMPCEACLIEKSVDDFSMMHSELDPRAPSPQVCDHCRRFGPPLEDPMRGLSSKHRLALKALASGSTVRAAARASGLDESVLRRSLAGKENRLFRAAFQRLMVDADLGPDKLIKIIKDATSAIKIQWNPAQEHFEEMADHQTRLKSATMMMKAWGTEEPKEAPEDNRTAIQVVVNTNLGSDDAVTVPGTIVARAPKALE